MKKTLKKATVLVILFLLLASTFPVLLKIPPTEANGGPMQGGTGINYINRTFSQEYLSDQFWASLEFLCMNYTATGSNNATKIIEFAGSNSSWTLWIYSINESSFMFYSQIATPDLSNETYTVPFNFSEWHSITFDIDMVQPGPYDPVHYEYYLIIDGYQWMSIVDYYDSSSWMNVTLGSIECSASPPAYYLFFFDALDTCDFYEPFNNLDDWTILGDCAVQDLIVYEGDFALQVPLTTQFVVYIKPTTAYLIIGKNQTFTCTPHNGIPPFTFQWFKNGQAVGTNSSEYVFYATEIGVFTVWCNVTDSTETVAKSNEAIITVTKDKETVDLTKGDPWLIGGLSGQLEWYRRGVFGDLSQKWTNEDITFIKAKRDEFAIATTHTLPEYTIWSSGAEQGTLNEFGSNIAEGGLISQSSTILVENFENWNQNNWSVHDEHDPPILDIPAEGGINNSLCLRYNYSGWAQWVGYIYKNNLNNNVIHATFYFNVSQTTMASGNYIILYRVKCGESYIAYVSFCYEYIEGQYHYTIRASGKDGSNWISIGNPVYAELNQWYKIDLSIRTGQGDGWYRLWVDNALIGNAVNINQYQNVTQVQFGYVACTVPYDITVNLAIDDITISSEEAYRTGFKIVTSPKKSGSYTLACYTDGVNVPTMLSYNMSEYGMFHVAWEADVLIHSVGTKYDDITLFRFQEKSVQPWGFRTQIRVQNGTLKWAIPQEDPSTHYWVNWWEGSFGFQEDVWHHVRVEINIDRTDEFNTSYGYMKVTVDSETATTSFGGGGISGWGGIVPKCDEPALSKFFFGMATTPPTPELLKCNALVIYFDNLRVYTPPVPSAQILTSSLFGTPAVVRGSVIDTCLGSAETSWKYRKVIVTEIEDCGNYWLIGGGYLPNIDTMSHFWVPFLFKVEGETVTNAFQGINFESILTLPYGDWLTGGWVSSITFCHYKVIERESPLLGEAVLTFAIEGYYYYPKWYTFGGCIIATYDGTNLTRVGMWSDVVGDSGAYVTASCWDREYVLFGDNVGRFVLWDGKNFTMITQTDVSKPIKSIATNYGWFEWGSTWRKYFLAVDGDYLYKIENKTLYDITDFIGSDAHPQCVGFNGEYFLIGGDKLWAKGCFVDLSEVDYITTRITALDSDVPALPFTPPEVTPPLAPEITYCLPLIFYVLMVLMFFLGLYLYSKHETWKISMPLIPIILWLIIFQPKIPIEQMPITFLRMFVVPPWHLYMAIILTVIVCIAVLSRKD